MYILFCYLNLSFDLGDKIYTYLHTYIIFVKWIISLDET